VSTAPVLARTREDLAAALAALGERAVLVPTMGALHVGHRALLATARTLAAGPVVVSVFVNPLQFDSATDLAAYPADLDADLAVCAQEGAAVVFAPSVDQMYPAGPPSVRVAAGELGARLEGAVRPGHFDGMLTVVAKLFGLVRPRAALFGQKDAQQLALVTRMVTDLELGVEVVAVPTVRDADGLAASSRNVRLDAAARARASAVPAALAAGAAAGSSGEADRVVGAATDVLTDAGLAVDYVALVDPGTFATVSSPTGRALLVLAARVGGVRLIDNTAVVLAPPTAVRGGP